jgi:hypothetical protein
MVTFIGTPNMLVTLKPPIGTIKHVRFDTKGEFTTDNERMIQRFHHKFDSMPATGEPTEELTDDLEYQDHGTGETKQFTCKKCEFTTESKGDLMVHYRKDHPKEG